MVSGRRVQRLAEERVAKQRVLCENLEIVMDKQVIRGKDKAIEVVERGEEEQEFCSTGHRRRGRDSRFRGRRGDERRQPAYEHQARHSERDLVPVQQQQQCPHPILLSCTDEKLQHSRSHYATTTTTTNVVFGFGGKKTVCEMTSEWGVKCAGALTKHYSLAHKSLMPLFFIHFFHPSCWYLFFALLCTTVVNVMKSKKYGSESAFIRIVLE